MSDNSSTNIQVVNNIRRERLLDCSRHCVRDAVLAALQVPVSLTRCFLHIHFAPVSWKETSESLDFNVTYLDKNLLHWWVWRARSGRDANFYQVFGHCPINGEISNCQDMSVSDRPLFLVC